MSLDGICALLFDMDGVLIDTHTSVESFWNELARKHQITLTAEDFERLIHGTQAWMTLDRYFAVLSADERRHVEADLTVYEDHLTYKLMPGVWDFLVLLKAHKIPTALVTSGSQRKVDAVFAQFDLSDKFDTVITADLVHHGKPDPECYRLAAQELSIPPQACIVFEDSVSGTQAGLSAGAQVIGLGKTQILLELGATQVIPDFSVFTIKPSEQALLTLVAPPDLEVVIA